VVPDQGPESAYDACPGVADDLLDDGIRIEPQVGRDHVEGLLVQRQRLTQPAHEGRIGVDALCRIRSGGARGLADTRAEVEVDADLEPAQRGEGVDRAARGPRLDVVKHGVEPGLAVGDEGEPQGVCVVAGVVVGHLGILAHDACHGIEALGRHGQRGQGSDVADARRLEDG